MSMSYCQHTWVDCSVSHYEHCLSCGTYHSTNFTNPNDLYSNYWGNEHPSMAEQCWNVDMHIENGVSKNKFIIDRIESERTAALEIGCAPGRLLFWLKWAARFQWISGVDPADTTEIRDISCGTADSLTSGLFPSVTALWEGGIFNYVASIDTFEHSPYTISFLNECQRLLSPGGQLFLMIPLADGLPADSRMFNAAEHVFLHSKANMEAMLRHVGFNHVKFDQWTIGHDAVSARKL